MSTSSIVSSVDQTNRFSPFYCCQLKSSLMIQSSNKCDNYSSKRSKEKIKNLSLAHNSSNRRCKRFEEKLEQNSFILPMSIAS